MDGFRRIALLCALWLTAAGFGAAAAGEALVRVAHLSDPQFGLGASREDDVANFKEAVEKAAALKPDFLVLCGDLSQKPNVEDWQVVKDALDRAGVPYFVAVGNHDVRVADKETRRLDEKSLDRFRGFWGRDYDARTVNGVKILLVDAMLQTVAGPDAEKAKQDEFVAKELADAKERNIPVIVVCHQPPFVKRPDEKDGIWNYPSDMRQAWLEQCADAGVVFMLCGHTHAVAERRFGKTVLLNGNVTSKSFDGAPLGFRMLTVAPDLSYQWEFHAVSRQPEAK